MLSPDSRNKFWLKILESLHKFFRSWFTDLFLILSWFNSLAMIAVMSTWPRSRRPSIRLPTRPVKKNSLSIHSQGPGTGTETASLSTLTLSLTGSFHATTTSWSWFDFVTQFFYLFVQRNTCKSTFIPDVPRHSLKLLGQVSFGEVVIVHHHWVQQSWFTKTFFNWHINIHSSFQK